MTLAFSSEVSAKIAREVSVASRLGFHQARRCTGFASLACFDTRPDTVTR